MKRFLAILLVIFLAGAGGFFYLKNQQTKSGPKGAIPSVEDQSGSVNQQDLEAKQGDTTLTGVITQQGEQFFITVPGQQPAAIDSYSVDLAQYKGQEVTVMGQYSGNTLFVGQVQ